MASRRNRTARNGGAPRKDGADPVLDVVVLILDGGYPSTAIGPVEVFHSAGNLWNVLHGDAAQPRFRVRSPRSTAAPSPPSAA